MAHSRLRLPRRPYLEEEIATLLRRDFVPSGIDSVSPGLFGSLRLDDLSSSRNLNVSSSRTLDGSLEVRIVIDRSCSVLGVPMLMRRSLFMDSSVCLIAPTLLIVFEA